ncbi:MAG: hypothetical protein AAGU74_06060 [Bacillota bacterium]
MPGPVWLNLGSLVLGLIAWILPAVNLARRNKTDRRSFAVFSTASLGACAVSLYMQILYTDHLVKIEDWSALMDTSSAVAFAALALLAGTILLNAAALAVYCKKKLKDDR